MARSHAKIRNEAGIHCRPSVLIMQAIEGYEGHITVKAKKKQTSLNSVLDLMAMGLLPGDKVEITVKGTDEKKMCAKLVELFERNFDFEGAVPPTQHESGTNQGDTT